MRERQTNEIHEALITCLADLNQIKLKDLINNEPLGQSLRFRTEVPFLERTLELFHRLSRRELSGLPSDVLQRMHANASETLSHFRAISTLAEEHPEHFDQALQDLIDEIKGSFDQTSANFVLCQGWEQLSSRSNTALAIGICTLVLALALVAYFSSRDKTVADVLLKAVHGIGLS
jgi:hypothetical protein